MDRLLKIKNRLYKVHTYKSRFSLPRYFIIPTLSVCISSFTEDGVRYGFWMFEVYWLRHCCGMEITQLIKE